MPEKLNGSGKMQTYDAETGQYGSDSGDKTRGKEPEKERKLTLVSPKKDIQRTGKFANLSDDDLIKNVII